MGCLKRTLCCAARGPPSGVTKRKLLSATYMVHFVSVLFFLPSYFFCLSHRVEQTYHRSGRSSFGEGRSWSLRISEMVILGTLLSARSSLTQRPSPHSMRFNWSLNIRSSKGNQASHIESFESCKCGPPMQRRNFQTDVL